MRVNASFQCLMRYEIVKSRGYAALGQLMTGCRLISLPRGQNWRVW
jgi:hypothetical protein